MEARLPVPQVQLRRRHPLDARPGHPEVLNDRQVKAVIFVKEKGKISNADYQELFSVSKATATRDLTELVDKFALFEKVGQTGAGTTYILKK